MSKQLIHCGLLAASLIGFGFAGAASAGKGGNNECPVGVLEYSPGDPDTTLDLEFGPGTQELTRCIARRNQVKLLIQINQYCARPGGTYGEESEQYPPGTPKCNRAYALQNIENVIADYKETYGMTVGKDYEIAAVVHSGGGPLVIQDGTNGKIINEFEGQVQDLMDLGVRFYFCQNTTRSYQVNGLLPADATGALVTSVDEDGVPHSVEYVTAGITALADFQRAGWTYVQP